MQITAKLDGFPKVQHLMVTWPSQEDPFPPSVAFNQYVRMLGGRKSQNDQKHTKKTCLNLIEIEKVKISTQSSFHPSESTLTENLLMFLPNLPQTRRRRRHVYIQICVPFYQQRPKNFSRFPTSISSTSRDGTPGIPRALGIQTRSADKL